MSRAAISRLNGLWKGRQVVLRPVQQHDGSVTMHAVPLERDPVNYVNVNSGNLVDVCDEEAEVQLSTSVEELVDLSRQELASMMRWRDHSMPADVAWTAQKNLRIGAAHGFCVTVRTPRAKTRILD